MFSSLRGTVQGRDRPVHQVPRPTPDLSPVGWRPSLLGSRPLLVSWEAIAIRFEAIVSKLGGHRY